MSLGPGQTQIQGDFAESILGPCGWCGSEATGVFEVAESKMGTAKGRELLKHRAVRSPACSPCLARLRSPEPGGGPHDPGVQLAMDLGAGA